MLNKNERARIILRALLKLAEIHGFDGPPRFSGGSGKVRYVDYDKRWSLHIYDGSRRAMARSAKATVRSSVLPAPGCQLIELVVHGAEKLILNVDGDDIQIFKFIPGLWEKLFDADPGADSVPILPDLFADPNEPGWQALMDSPDGYWPSEEEDVEQAASSLAQLGS